MRIKNDGWKASSDVYFCVYSINTIYRIAELANQGAVTTKLRFTLTSPVINCLALKFHHPNTTPHS